jgi:uncharacterized membrane protein SirB2
MNSYLLIKTVHLSCVAAAFLLFAGRGAWMLSHPGQARPKWTRIVPHIVDSVLLASAIGLVLMSGQYPGELSWLNAKITALLIYIGLGMVAFRFACTPAGRMYAWLAGMVVFLYIVLVALTRSPWPGF